MCELGPLGVRRHLKALMIPPTGDCLILDTRAGKPFLTSLFLISHTCSCHLTCPHVHLQAAAEPLL